MSWDPEKKVNGHRPMEIADGYFVTGADFDCEEPFIKVANSECTDEEKMLVPESLAYYLRTHWCGSNKMHDLIRTNAVRDLQSGMRDLLGIK